MGSKYEGKILRVTKAGFNRTRSSRGWKNLKEGSLVRVINFDGSSYGFLPLLESEREISDMRLWSFSTDPWESLTGTQYLERL